MKEKESIASMFQSIQEETRKKADIMIALAEKYNIKAEWDKFRVLWNGDVVEFVVVEINLHDLTIYVARTDNGSVITERNITCLEYIDENCTPIKEEDTIVIVKLSKETEEFLIENGNMFIESQVYYFLPFWFQKLDDDGEYAMHSLGNLPRHLEKHIKAMRNDKA